MLDQIVAGSTQRSFARGQTILRQGDPCGCLHVVLEGVVELSVVSPAGREAIVDLLGPGDLFGEGGLFGDPAPSSVRAAAVGLCRVAVVPHARLRTMMHTRPDVAVGLLRVVAERLRRTSDSLQDMLLHDAPTRVSRRLAALARDHGRPAPGGTLVDAPLTQSDLARLVGSSRETVNRALAGISAAGLVRVRGGRYLVCDPEGLESLGNPS